jgi:cobalt-zinc-cadmium efflux system membrane fusion protein
MTNHVKWTSGLLVVVVAVGTCACGGRSTTREAAPKAEAGETSEKSTKADVDQRPDAIEIPSETQQRLGIVVSSVAEGPLAMTLTVSGTVQPNESRVSRVRPLARGRVQAVRVKVGDRVTQGQVLADFDNIEAGELATQRDAARAELARLQAQLATATRQAERSRKLADIGAAPQKEYEANLSEQHQIEASITAQQSTVAGMEARLRRFGLQEGASGGAMTSIRSPLTGVVTHVAAAPGEVVDATSELFAIADLSRVYVQAQVFEQDLGQVRVGQLAAIRVDAYPDERFTGSVVAIGDVIDPQTRTAAVRCDVANPKSLLKLDMFATVELPTGNRRPALAVPTDAVQNYEGKSVVFVRASATRFEVRPVEVGRTVGAVAEVARGVRAGESVVTRGAFQVKSALLAKELGEKDDDKDKKE